MPEQVKSPYVMSGNVKVTWAVVIAAFLCVALYTCNEEHGEAANSWDNARARNLEYDENKYNDKANEASQAGDVDRAKLYGSWSKDANRNKNNASGQ